MAGKREREITTKSEKGKRKENNLSLLSIIRAIGRWEAKKKMGDLYALDFDGVLCDSCGESSLSAVKVLLSHFSLI